MFVSTYDNWMSVTKWKSSKILFICAGKTMVARILGKLLHMVGVLSTDNVTEVQRTDLVGEFVGHTGPKTRNKVQLDYSHPFLCQNRCISILVGFLQGGVWEIYLESKASSVNIVCYCCLKY